jgi:hypothetical protein
MILRKCIHSPISAGCEQRWRSTTLRKGLCNANAASAFGTCSASESVWLAGTPNYGKCVIPKQHFKCWNCGGDHTANNRGCSIWTEAKAAVAKRAQGERGRKDGVSTHLFPPASAPFKPSTEQEKLGSGWSHLVRRGRVVNGQATLSLTANSSAPVRRTARQDARRVVNVMPLVLRCRQRNSNHKDPSGLTPPFPLHRGSNRSRDCRSPGQPPYQGCIELTRRLLSTTSSLPKGEVRPRHVLKTLVLFTPEYGCAAYNKSGESLAAGLIEH